MRAAIYARVSTPGQAEKHTIDQQLTECQAYCETKGYEVIGKFHDDWMTGTTPFMERPNARRLLDAYDRGDWQVESSIKAKHSVKEDAGAELQAAESRVLELEAKESRLLDGWERGIYTDEQQFRKRTEPVCKDIEAARQRLNELQQATLPKPKRFTETMLQAAMTHGVSTGDTEGWAPARWQKLLQDLEVQVKVDPDGTLRLTLPLLPDEVLTDTSSRRQATKYLVTVSQAAD